jgi:hypothetical protein
VALDTAISQLLVIDGGSDQGYQLQWLEASGLIAML